MNELLLRRRLKNTTREYPLPEGAVEVEFLKQNSSKTAYIDTGLYLTGNDEIECKFNVSSRIYSGNIWGASGSSANDKAIYAYNTSTGYIFVGFSNDGSRYARPGNKGTFTVKLTKNEISVDGSKVVTSAIDGNFTTSNTLLLFSGHVQGFAPSANVSIYYFKVEGKLNLVPIRINTTGYMFDKVSGTLFGNAGTGSFILGPDK